MKTSMLWTLVCTLAIVLFCGFSFISNGNKFQTRDTKETDKKRMEFNDWLNGRFHFKHIYPYWISGDEYITKKSNGSLVKVNMETEVEFPFLPAYAWCWANDGNPLTYCAALVLQRKNTTSPSSWHLSADQQFVAMIHGDTDGYAHYNRTFSVNIWDVETGQKLDNVDIPEKEIQKFKWSPTGHTFAYVHGFNVYINTVFNTSYPITSNGNELLQFNGIADWQFSGEFTVDDALLWWSPDGQYLAYLTITHTEQVLYEFTLYNNLTYPQRISFPYPKPGHPIPECNMFVYDVINASQTKLAPNINPLWNGYYLNSAVWRGNIFTPTWKNRLENKAITENCQAPNFACSHGSNMRASSHTGWLGNYKVSHTFPLNNSDEYLTVESHEGFPHVTLHNTADDTIDVRTSGQFEVTDVYFGYNAIHFYDVTYDWIYFTSTEVLGSPGVGLPGIRHVWRVKGHGEDRHRECISCMWDYYFPDRCKWVNASFSLDGTYQVINCYGSGDGVPVSILNKRGESGWYEFVRILEENLELESTIAEYHFRSVEFGTLQLPDVEGDWYYMLLKPPNFDPNKKYPLLVQVYSGPGYQEVEHRFSVTWRDYIASSKDIVVMSFDGRGTGYRGDQIRHMVYKKLGQYEPIDQIEAVRTFIKQNLYIDDSKIAIWGKSYGGYVTTRVINEDHDRVFRCGFALAPVVKWELYNTIYTEKYMLLPVENQDGYEKSSTLQNWENFQSHRYSVFHGTRDENVHFQNAAQLSKYLIEHEVDFRAYFAADDDHGLGRVPNNYRTIFKMLTHQLEICFR